MSIKKIAVVGGGASGIFAAIGAGLASQRDNNFQIVLFEKNSKIGKPILRSGNGRCNLSNSKIEADEALELLSSRGLLTETKSSGEIFPFSNKAQSILDLCLEIIDECNVNISCDSEVQSLSDLKDFDCKIICTGHDTTRDLLPSDARFYDFEPLLCPIEVKEKDVSTLNNLRAKAIVTVTDPLGVVIFEEGGEVQFRDYGLSGIVIFNASRYAKSGDKISLSFKPKEIDDTQFHELINQRFQRSGNYEGIVARELSDYLVAHHLSPASLTFTISKLHDDAKQVQVYRGGVDKRDTFNYDEMVFVCGEALDFDGPCGGFNISHAFNSGLKAGKASVEYLRVLDALREGKVVGIPTDTVYGIALSVENCKSQSEINVIKGSPVDKPIAWLISDKRDIEKYSNSVHDYVYQLIEDRWPGDLTIILDASDRVKSGFRSSNNTIALRMPNDACTLSLIDKLGSPIAASSANFSGERAPMSFSDCDERLLSKISCSITTSDRIASGVASTIIDCTGEVPKKIR